ncbi:MAG: hypothetical protein JO244_08750, partial [Solirubrobacterales bacterium]|nr:hypothetical protein [Solirubrobacterales bacterium]
GLTGANTLAGRAQPAGDGSIVHLEGGGELQSSTPADGPVQVAIHPWVVELTDPLASRLTDTVLSIRPDRGALVVRLARLTARIDQVANGRGPIREGDVVGVQVAPADVRLLPG